MTDTPKKQRRGFAAMDPEKQRAIAAKGGKSVPAAKRSFFANRELASQAGRTGGLSSPDKFKFRKVRKGGPR